MLWRPSFSPCTRRTSLGNWHSSPDCPSQSAVFTRLSWSCQHPLPQGSMMLSSDESHDRVQAHSAHAKHWQPCQQGTGTLYTCQTLAAMPTEYRHTLHMPNTGSHANRVQAHSTHAKHWQPCQQSTGTLYTCQTLAAMPTGYRHTLHMPNTDSHANRVQAHSTHAKHWQPRQQSTGTLYTCQTLAAIPLFGHLKILHTLIGMGN